MDYTDKDELEAKRICHDCVKVEFLSGEIKADDDKDVCAYCGKSAPTWPLVDLANRIELAFEQHCFQTSDQPTAEQSRMQADEDSIYEWYRDGEPVVEAIEAAAEIPTEAAEDVLELLSSRHYDHDNAAMGEECPFDGDSYYELKDYSAFAWQLEWTVFENSLQTEARFFSRSAAGLLTDLFREIDKFRTRDDRPLVVDAGPGHPVEHLYRAREFQSEDGLLDAMRRPDKGLAPPPSRFATAGRMNPRGIAVFYGAEESEVAIAEVRPSVGSRVAVAQFSIIRPLKLLDLTALAAVHAPGSIFDPAFKDKLERVAFLRTLGQKISRPIMPSDKDFDYLPTQAIADFLANENDPPLDGIIFMSAQMKAGRNIVLFHKAARVASLNLPKDTEIGAYTGFSDEDGFHAEYRVHEHLPPEPDPAPEQPNEMLPFWAHFSQMNLDADTRINTLRVNTKSVVVHHVEQISVVTDAHPVSRHSSVKSK
ncbi:RES domain-containing protein [Pseudomonas cavernae]|uniref:RES domain-containing protein n=1 Tax=Pseudomonas cavernae TaxID=2320867 RepID=A0A385Z816_9PSED|nr:RES family NAD+ phosphorylase [Pseudomonas cavernae]AYC34690.1 RES domain-containing protein [Pseudomonas cavernae]